MDKLSTNTSMNITEEQQQEFNTATQCYICKKAILLNDKKVVKLEITVI